jgi:large conductance mechanosensitive channel
VLKEFRSFLFRGNLLDLATAVVLGVAFQGVVSSLVKDVITPFIAAMGGKPNFDELTMEVGDGVIRYGTFLNAVINFVIIAAVIFLILKAAVRAQKALAKDAGETEAAPPTDEAVLLAEIRDILRAQA